MTLAEKLKDARKNAALSQEQLAEKLCVSRSAVAKWESGKGLPDIENLKAISKLLDVSIDYLVDDGAEMDFRVTKEQIDLDSYEVTGRCRVKQDAAVLARFPEATRINQLSLIHQLNKIEWWADFFTCRLYTMIWGLSHWKTWTGYYYLVEQAAADNPLYRVTADNYRVHLEKIDAMTEKILKEEMPALFEKQEGAQ